MKLGDTFVPYICKSRKYNDEEYQFLKAHNQSLVDAGLGYVNHNSRWASRVLPVKKKDYGTSQLSKPLPQSELLMAAYRQTVDYVVVNRKCISLAGEMPYQDVALEHAMG